jgi:NADPH-dependent glutamate synthase beta subunit-like oxidoreductase/NAD(P)H-flavin reductase
MTHSILQLNHFTFAELFNSTGLKRLDTAFLDQLEQPFQQNLIAYRQQTKSFTSLEISDLLIACSRNLEHFLADLFNIQEAVALAQIKTCSNNPISVFKKYFVLRKAKKLLHNSEGLPSFAELTHWLESQLVKAPVTAENKELNVALLGNFYVEAAETYHQEIEQLTQWCVQALSTPDGKAYTHGWSCFYLPERLEFQNLVPTVVSDTDKLSRASVNDDALRQRDGFKLTDPRMDAAQVQDQVNYCIYCHDHDGDFCSKGFPTKKGDPSQGFKKNPLDTILAGCPLEEKISEMNLLKRDGQTLAALAMVMVDNPMCPATGHRICNDCMKSCIYQKQEPVNIPQIETRVLTDVLALPWGVEIYDLLTRWNPLRQRQYIMKPYNGLKVMIAGMGPAGFTLAHHLLLEGFGVVGFDGLKIEPLPSHLISEPIHQFSSLTEALDERLMAGFGGVAEYGITVRWDKNFLKLIYISLSRKPYFQVFGGVRFGGTITVEDAWEMGFDHLAIAVGAGLPKALSIPGSLAPGMRQANDFLMALQLGNAAKNSSLTNLQIRLPAVIIGGGLTGVDTATEVQAYYITQVEKTLLRYEKLSEIYGEQHLRKNLDTASIEILDEFLSHGKTVREERLTAKANQRSPDFIKLIRQWGGVTIVYRRSMQESPAYINNHEELKKALEEGIYYADKLEPLTAILNQHGHVETLVCHKRLRKNADKWEATVEEVTLPARAILVATGTQPNIAYEFEHKGTLQRLGLQYQHYEDKDGELVIPHGSAHCKEPDFGAFTSYRKEHRYVSLIGDTHPVFHGNVVKAITSGLRTYPKILDILHDKLNNIGLDTDYQTFAKSMSHLFNAKIARIIRRTENVVELYVHAPLAVKKFKAGQFFRLQNFETFSQTIAGTTLQMEPLALIGADVDEEHNLLKFIVIEKGATSKLCATLKVNDPVSLMGPTGIKHKVAEEHETVLIIGTQLSLALISSYGKALKAAGNKVIYVGCFQHSSDIYCKEIIENAADVVIWVTKDSDQLSSIRTQDYASQGNAVEALVSYANGKLDPHKTQPEISLADIDRVFVIGNTDFLRRFQEARKTSLKDLLLKNPRVSGSVYSTMQCMLKGVCAQCLQWQIDPETGQRTKAVFACSWPEQPLELVDFDNLDERLSQNRLQETLNSLWIDYLFEHCQVERV